MKPRLLIIPASIRSHVLPSLYIADRLADEYEVVYVVTNDILAEIVEANGYQAIRHSGNVVGYGAEAHYITSLKQKPTFMRLLKAFYTHEVFEARKKELDEIIARVSPSVIIIDLFVCTDYWLLHSYRDTIKLLFFNPMPSTYRVKGYAAVYESYSPTPTVPTMEESKTKKPVSKTALMWLKNPKQALMQWAIQKNRRFLESIAPLASDATVTQVIADVPELVLAPLEFEFSPEIQKSNQHYLGLCMRPHRQDTELDPAFEKVWKEITSAPLHRGEGQGVRFQQLIYCSFGTFHEGADAHLLKFITNLLEVIQQIPNTLLICATNKYLIETLHARKLITARTHFFTRVPQMQVLAQADVFITHAGFGSIKEAIYYGVPMLAYPLDPRYDQNGNALNIEHHGLGLRGSFNHERPADLKKKLARLLYEPVFKQRIEEFKTQITAMKTEDILYKLLGEKETVLVA